MKWSIAGAVLIALSLWLWPFLAAFTWVFTGLDAFGGHLRSLTLYAGLMSLGWGLGRSNPTLSIILAIVFPVAAGVGTPLVLNADFDQAAETLRQQDHRAPAPLRTPKVVALLSPDYRGSAIGCALLCQRLLYRGGVSAVLAGETPASGLPQAATGLVRYRIERKASCPKLEVVKAAVITGEHFVYGTYPTSEHTHRQIASGLCLVSGTGNIAQADTIAVETQFSSEEYVASRRVGGGVASAGEAVLQKEGSEWVEVARSTAVKYERANFPLLLLPMQGSEHRPKYEPVIERTLRPWLG